MIDWYKENSTQIWYYVFMYTIMGLAIKFLEPFLPHFHAGWKEQLQWTIDGFVIYMIIILAKAVDRLEKKGNN